MDLEELKEKVASTMSAGPSVRVLLEELCEMFAETLKADGLDESSQTAQLIASLRTETPILAHLAEIGTKDH